MKPNYKKYLESNKWKKIRLKKLMQVPFCERCGSKHRLQVHHKSYHSFGREELIDLSVLCKKCHRLVHQFKARY